MTNNLSSEDIERIRNEVRQELFHTINQAIIDVENDNWKKCNNQSQSNPEFQKVKEGLLLPPLELLRDKLWERITYRQSNNEYGDSSKL